MWEVKRGKVASCVLVGFWMGGLALFTFFHAAPLSACCSVHGSRD